MLMHWIWLATRPGLSERAKVLVWQHFSDPEDAYYADSTAYVKIPGVTRQMQEALQDKNIKNAQRILEQCADKNIHILTIQDAAYPSRLRNIVDPPLVLYYKGKLPDFDGVPLIGVVGTRKASPYGITIAKRMGYQVARCGGTVVSGAAYGIDGMAMSGALSAGGTVIGVLGCGADVVYPLPNKPLYADTERYGCLLTEYPPGTPPIHYHFPKRNRIISGLSCGVLVVEAPYRSGALNTARQAAEQGRDVFVVPGNVDVATCAGSNALLREGAIAVTHGWDVLSEYEALYPGKVHPMQQQSRMNAYPDEMEMVRAEAEKKPLKVAQKPRILEKIKASKRKNDKKVIDNGEPSPYIDVEKSLPELSSEEQAVIDQLKQGERLTDDVIAESGLPAGKMLAVLTMLEVKGLIKRLPGNRLALK